MRKKGREEEWEEAEDGGVFPPITIGPADLITAATAAENVAAVIGKDDEDNIPDPAADTIAAAVRDAAASRPDTRRWELSEGREKEAAAIMLALSLVASSLCALQRSAVTLVPRLAATCIEDDACNDDDDRDGPEDDEDEGGDDGGNDNDDEREEEEEELEEEDE